MTADDVNAVFRQALCLDEAEEFPKPNVVLVGDAKSHTVYYIEGLEGRHKGLSDHMTEQYSRPHFAYLNHGYFLVKPMFHIMNNIMTGDSIVMKTGVRSKRQGIFELQDVETGEECVLWCYTDPRNIAKWQGLKTDIESIITKAIILGIETDEEGYLPIILRIGRAPTVAPGQVYGKAVGLHLAGTNIHHSDLNEPTNIGHKVKKRNNEWER